MEPTVNRYIYSTTTAPEPQGLLWNRSQKCKSYKTRGFIVKFSLLAMSETTYIKSQRHDCQNMNWIRTITSSSGFPETHTDDIQMILAAPSPWVTVSIYIYISPKISHPFLSWSWWFNLAGVADSETAGVLWSSLSVHGKGRTRSGNQTKDDHSSLSRAPLAFGEYQSYSRACSIFHPKGDKGSSLVVPSKDSSSPSKPQGPSCFGGCSWICSFRSSCRSVPREVLEFIDFIQIS